MLPYYGDVDQLKKRLSILGITDNDALFDSASPAMIREYIE
jgi:hypothetical protein